MRYSFVGFARKTPETSKRCMEYMCVYVCACARFSFPWMVAQSSLSIPLRPRYLPWGTRMRTALSVVPFSSVVDPVFCYIHNWIHSFLTSSLPRPPSWVPSTGKSPRDRSGYPEMETRRREIPLPLLRAQNSNTEHLLSMHWFLPGLP